MSDPSVTLDLPIKGEIAFADAKGQYKARQEKKQRKLLAKVAPLLRRVLEPEEQILYVTTAISPYNFLELYTTGWMITVVKRSLLVVTDRRLLHLPTKSNYEAKQSIAQIRYAGVAEVKVSSFLGRKLTVVYNDGKKEAFTGFPGQAVKMLRQILPPLVGRGTLSATVGRRHLCPRCAAVLGVKPATCASCGLEFKTEAKAVKYSLIFPGGGYFYTDHFFMGLADAFFETMLIFLVIFGFMTATGPEGDEYSVMGSIVLLVLLAFEKLVTIYHAKHYVREHLPAKGDFSLTVSRRTVGGRISQPSV